MLSKKEVLASAKKGHTLKENLKTQPFEHQVVFGNPSVLAKSWYIICPSKELKRQQAKSFNLVRQRIVLFRGKTGGVKCLDAFCPHLGTDLGNGIVEGESLLCLFHKWKFNSDGELTDSPCGAHKRLVEKAKLNSYPTQEKFGFIWVFSSKEATHEIPKPIELFGQEVESLFLREVQLKVHPHILMMNAVDLQHFKTLHKINADISFTVNERTPEWIEWDIIFKVKSGNLAIRLARFLFGNNISYKVIYAGATIAGISVKMPGLFSGKGPMLPSINILWASKPNASATGSIYNFLVIKKYRGFFAPIKRLWAYIISLSVLMMLRDDDIFVFPNMRFFLKNPASSDKSLIKYMSFVNSLQASEWGDSKNE